MTTPIINCKLMNFPVKGKEMVIPNEDGSYTVLINARLSDAGRMAAYEHALRHIIKNDFEKNDVQEIESNAHDNSNSDTRCHL